MKIPKIQFRGDFAFFAALIAISICLSIGAFYFSNEYSTKNQQLETTIASMEGQNVDALTIEENRLKKENDDLMFEIDQIKKEVVTKFDKDLFSTTLSTFAKVNDIELTSFQERGFTYEKDGFYSVRYDLTLEGSIYGMMEFFNLIKDMGTQYSVDYFSFRQDGTYSWLSRTTDKEDFLSWVNSAKDTVTAEMLEEMIDLNTKIEKNEYDYGQAVEKPASTKEDYDPLQNLLDDLLQQEYDATEIKDYEAEKAEQAEKTEKALAEKEEDKKAVQEFLEKYYPEGTIIKDGQLIVPVLDGNMKFDMGITFTGNDSGSTPNTELGNYLTPPSATTSEEKDVVIYWEGKRTNIPNIIEGVDVTVLNGINIDSNSSFTVSWNNNELTRHVIESFLAEKDDGGYSELNRVAAEIRFLQKNGKIDLDMMEYLIYLYQYLTVKGVIS